MFEAGLAPGWVGVEEESGSYMVRDVMVMRAALSSVRERHGLRFQE